MTRAVVVHCHSSVVKRLSCLYRALTHSESDKVMKEVSDKWKVK